MHAIRVMYQQSQNYRSPIDIAGVYLLGPHFRRCMCYSLIFFLISTRKSIIYALLYISATLNQRIFSGGGLWMKKINICRRNNSSGTFTFLSYITGTSMQ